MFRNKSECVFVRFSIRSILTALERESVEKGLPPASLGGKGPTWTGGSPPTSSPQPPPKGPTWNGESPNRDWLLAMNDELSSTSRSPKVTF